MVDIETRPRKALTRATWAFVRIVKYATPRECCTTVKYAPHSAVDSAVDTNKQWNCTLTEHIIFIRCYFLLNNFQYKNAIFYFAVYRNAIKFTYIGYN